MLRCKAATGNNAVHMDMVTHFLVPGMKYLDDPGCCAEPLFVSGEFQKCLGAAPVQERIKELLVAGKQGVELMWECKDHMEVGGVNDFCPSFIHPDLFVYRLTVGAVTVPAGIVVELQMPAVRALGNVDPQFSGLTGKDGPGGFLLYGGGAVSLVQEILIGVFPDASDLQVIHPASLPSSQRGFWQPKGSLPKGGHK